MVLCNAEIQKPRLFQEKSQSHRRGRGWSLAHLNQETKIQTLRIQSVGVQDGAGQALGREGLGRGET